MRPVLGGSILVLVALFYLMSPVSAQGGGNFTGEKNVTPANIKVVLDHSGTRALKFITAGRTIPSLPYPRLPG